MAGAEDLHGGQLVHLGSRHFPALSLRPNHALGLEDIHSGHTHLAGRDWCVDANFLQYLGVNLNDYACYRRRKASEHFFSA